MKRLFARKDKSTAPSASTTSDTAARSRASDVDDGLSAPTMTQITRRKSGFLLSSKAKQTPSSSSSGGFGSSTPLTTSSFSGSSNASSSYVSTPVEEPVTPLATENGSVTTKSWPSWVANIGKKKLKTSTTSSFANVPQTRREAVNSTAHRSSSTKKPTIVTDTSEDSDSDESSEDYWDRAGNDPAQNAKANRKATIKAPASGRRRDPPNSTSAQTRSIFGNGATSYPSLTRDASKALTNLQSITLDALLPPVSHPPLVQNSGHAAFPRSSNRVRSAESSSVGRTHTPLHVEILRKRLLKRIERRTLTAAEQASIQPLAHKSGRPRNAAKRKLPAAEETYEDSKAVGGGWSKGMKKWATRPCFEDRVVQFKPTSTGIASMPVEKDVRFGVAALEFSEGAEALAGLHRQNELPPPPSDIYVPASNRKLPPPLVVPRVNKGGIAKSSVLAGVSSLARAKAPPSRLRPTTVESHLLSSQDEDDLPLGVVMSRRRQQEQRETGEQEARKQRVAAAKAERERQLREQEEKTRRLAEEVIAARSRREKERAGKKAAKDAWLEGDADALPPPSKPFAGQVRSNSNPNFSPTSSTFSNTALKSTNLHLQVSPSNSGSTIAAIPAATQRQDLPRRQTAPMNSSAHPNSPWTGLTPSTSPVSIQSEWRTSTSFPQIPMPMSAPAGQLNYGMMMMPPVPDPAMLSMFEQNMMRPWVYGGTPNGSAGNLTPPIPPFVGSSGDSAGSLTPPTFPHSRPSSFAGSHEDMMFMMRKAPSSPGHRPSSGFYSSGGSAEDWQQANRGGSKGDLRAGSQPMLSADSAATASNGHRFGSLSGNRKSSKKPDSPPGNTPSHQRQISSKSAPHDSHSHSHSHSHQRQKSSTPTTKSHGRGNDSPRSSTHPPLPTMPAVKNPYGLSPSPFSSQPTLSTNGYAGGTASMGRRSGLSHSHSKDLLNSTSNTSATATSIGYGSLGTRPQRPAMPSHLKNGTTSSERRSRLFA